MSFSYSSISLYEQCPFKYKLKSIDKLQEPENYQANRGKELHYAIEQAIKTLPILPNELSYLHTNIMHLKDKGAKSEYAFGLDKNWQPVEFSSKSAWIRGVYDVLVFEDNLATITDWKTGKIRDYTGQLEFYATTALALFPEIEFVSTNIYYLDHKEGKSGQVYNRDMLPALKEKVINKIAKMEHDDIYAPKPNQFCKWCHFKKDNGGPCQW